MPPPGGGPIIAVHQSIICRFIPSRGLQEVGWGGGGGDGLAQLPSGERRGTFWTCRQTFTVAFPPPTDHFSEGLTGDSYGCGLVLLRLTGVPLSHRRRGWS